MENVKQVTQTKEEKVITKKAPPSTGLWRTASGRFLPMVEMTEAELKANFLFAAKMELKFHNKAIKISEVMEELEMVAEAKGLTLEYPHEVENSREYNGFYKNRKEYLERKKARKEVMKNQLLA